MDNNIFYINLKNDYVWVNAEIEINFSEEFLKFTFTDEEIITNLHFPL